MNTTLPQLSMSSAHSGCYVSPIFKQPAIGPSSPTTSPLPSLMGTGVSGGSSTASSPGRTTLGASGGAGRTQGRFGSPTGFNRPVSIPTPVRTVRRMFHYASPSDRKAFYDAFLDRPMNAAS